jgi:hypothetical protein
MVVDLTSRREALSSDFECGVWSADQEDDRAEPVQAELHRPLPWTRGELELLDHGSSL